MSVDNLLSGFLGALVGVLATVGLYLWDRRHRQRTAGQALRAELANNYTNLKLFLDIEAPGPVPLGSALWLSLAPSLAGLLGGDFAKVAFAYFHIPQAEAIRLRHAGGPGPSQDEQTELAVARDAVREAMRVLSAKLGEPPPRDEQEIQSRALRR